MMVRHLTFDVINKIGEEVYYDDKNKILLCSDNNTTMSIGEFHDHDFYEIQYVFKGEGVENINDRSYAISAGSIVIFSPNTVHTYYSTNDLSLVNICFKPNEIQKQKIAFVENILFKLLEQDSYEYEILYHLLQHSISNSLSGYRTEQYFDMLLNIVCTFSMKKVHSEKRWSELMLCIAKDFSTIKLEDAAKICGFSKGYFSRVFKKDFGKSFVQYIDTVKIEKAKSLLSNKELSIEQISLLLGFSHQTRFYRKFKEIIGMTPKEYRNKFFL